MTYAELFILRHGETEWNRAGRMQGGLDSPLTALGREQAVRQRDLVAGLELPSDMPVHVSPQGRARATAEIVLGDRIAGARFDDRLREIHLGDWDGLTRAEIDRRAPGLDDCGMIGWMDLAPGGEGLAGLEARVADWLAGLDGPAITVTHGTTSRMIRRLVLGLDLDGMEELPGGQGIIYHLRAGEHRRIG
ncbi:MAG: histidine phosphatase family protein [Paracoccaceae bacterium]|nr:histidine phosphatase family protein [Paracoccaceae bacterium]